MTHVPLDPRITQDLKKKLQAFDRISQKVAMRVAASAQNNPMLSEALHTKTLNTQNSDPFQSQSTGVQVGNFAVFAMPNAHGKTRYDVANMTTGQKIVGDLHIAESASSIVKLLNKNYSFYSPQIKTILELEQSYVKHYQDAVQYQRKNKASATRDTIMESRFIHSRDQAQQTKEKLLAFIKTL